MNKIDICREIVAESQYRKVSFTDGNGKNRKIIIDLFTASAIIRVYDNVKTETQEKLAAMNWGALQNVAFKILT